MPTFVKLHEILYFWAEIQYAYKLFLVDGLPVKHFQHFRQDKPYGIMYNQYKMNG